MIAKPLTHGEKVCRFIGGLTLSGDFLGQPFVLQDWQRDIILRLFDDVDEKGERVILECGVWLPRKNGKTELVAAIAAAEFFMSPLSGEIYTAAAEREQAGIIYRVVSGMIRRNPKLHAKCKLIDSQKRIIHKTTGTLFCSLSSEAGTKHGFNPSLVIGDEIHVWRDRELWTALTTGSATRKDPLFITITTAGLYSKNSFEWEKWDYAQKVSEGIFEDPAYLPVIYAADKEEDWLDEKVWHRVNPALGTFRSLDNMRLLAEKARRVPALENDFRRLYLNQHTAQQTRWLSMEQWDAGRRPDFADTIRAEPCWCGLDLSTKRDITAFVMLFRYGDGYALLPRFYIPRDTAEEREREDRIPYRDWIARGYVQGTPGERVDYQYVRADINEMAKRYRIQQIAIDPWNAAGIVEDLQGDGFKVIEVMQSFRHSNEPARELEALLANGDLVHTGNPCMDWMANNVEVARTPGGHIRPVKASETNRVDGITSLVMALGRAMLDEVYESAYEEEGQLSL